MLKKHQNPTLKINTPAIMHSGQGIFSRAINRFGLKPELERICMVYGLPNRMGNRCLVSACCRGACSIALLPSY